MSEKLEEIIDRRWEIVKQAVNPDITRASVACRIYALYDMSQHLFENPQELEKICEAISEENK